MSLLLIKFYFSYYKTHDYFEGMIQIYVLFHKRVGKFEKVTEDYFLEFTIKNDITDPCSRDIFLFTYRILTDKKLITAFW